MSVLPVGISGEAGGYQISRSVRLRSSASAYFSRTPGSAGNRRKWTWSGWFKRGGTAVNQRLFSAVNGSNYDGLFFNADQLTFEINTTTSGTNTINTTPVYRDFSAWYHVVAVWDSDNATQSNRMILYINGSRVTALSSSNYPASTGVDSVTNGTFLHTLGNKATVNTQYLDGYLTEINFIDGQALTPSSFGQNDPVTGVWQPIKYTGTYGTNGFYLNFSNNASTTTLGYDTSGNNNNWTTNNISLTSGVTYDSMTDVPTPYADGGNGRGNYATLNPVAMTSNISATNGNLTTSFTGLSNAAIYGTFMLPTSGKWYFESTITTVNTASSQDAGFGIVDATTTLSNISAQTFSNGVIYRNRGDSDSRIVVNGSSVVSGNTYSWATNDVVQIAYDADSGKVWIGRNNSWFDTSGGTTGNPSSGTNQIGTLTTTINMIPVARAYSNTLVMNWNFGQRPFAYTPPTGFKALNTYNLPDSTIVKGGSYFNTVLYTGTGATNAITGVGFQPDFTWIKGRSGATSHGLYDSVRGVQKQLISNSTAAETTESTGLTVFGSDGFTVGSLAQLNTSTATYVGWNWKASGTTVTNTAGSITSTVSVNTTSGFSIVTYTGTAVNGTVGHGLGVAPKFIIARRRDNVVNWYCYHSALAAGEIILLNLTNAKASVPTAFNSGSPTSITFPVGADSTTNASGGLQLAYCFAPVAGYSAFGSYTGNGSADGPFVFTGFRPRFVMVKRTDASNFWLMMDSSRSTYNVMGLGLTANTSDAEFSWSPSKDFLSNGFKVRTSDAAENASGGTYIYMAFAENAFKVALAR